MKNIVKNAFALLAISASLVACKGSSSSNNADTAKADSSVTTADTTVKADSTKKDTTAMADTTAKPAGDTISKKTTVKTVVKKDVVKKQ